MLSHSRYGVITEVQLSKALYSFHNRPDLIDTIVAMFGALPRDEAERWARMVSMSASVCVAVGFTPEQDMAMLDDPEWQGLLEVLIEAYDRLDKADL